MRLLPKACAWCHQVIWPWQALRRFEDGSQDFHQRCWLGIILMRDQDEVPGI